MSKTLKELKEEAAQWRVRYVHRQFNWLTGKYDTGNFNDFPDDPEQGWHYYMRESNMRSPQTALVAWSSNGVIKTQVQKRDSNGNWVEVPGYVW